MNEGLPGSVVLLHGLWMGPYAMRYHAAMLGKAGFRVSQFRYASVSAGLDDHVQCFLDALARASHKPVGIVAHSMGGIVALAACAHPGVSDVVRRIVLLGTPLRGSAAGRGLGRWPAGAWLLGRSNVLWRTQELSVPPGIAVGVIAGSGGFGLGRLVARLPSPNDGTVAVAETRIDALTDHLVLPVTHTGMLVSARAAAAIHTFLAQGRFHDQC